MKNRKDKHFTSKYISHQAEPKKSRFQPVLLKGYTFENRSYKGYGILDTSQDKFLSLNGLSPYICRDQKSAEILADDFLDSMQRISYTDYTDIRKELNSYINRKKKLYNLRDLLIGRYWQDLDYFRHDLKSMQISLISADKIKAVFEKDGICYRADFYQNADLIMIAHITQEHF